MVRLVPIIRVAMQAATVGLAGTAIREITVARAAMPVEERTAVGAMAVTAAEVAIEMRGPRRAADYYLRRFRFIPV